MRERSKPSSVPENPSEAINYLISEMEVKSDGKNIITERGKEVVQEFKEELIKNGGRVLVIDGDGKPATVFFSNKLKIQGRDGASYEISEIQAAAMWKLGEIDHKYTEILHNNHYFPAEFIG